MSVQTYLCLGCNAEVTRVAVRGQRPKWCADCRARGRRERTCVTCGKVGVMAGAIRCSRACDMFDRPDVVKSCTVMWDRCLVCLRHFTRQRLKQHDWQTCSAQCEAEASAVMAKAPSPVVARECPRCAKTFTTNQPHQVHCSPTCSRKAIRLRRRVRERDTYGDWTWGDFMRMARRFEYCCAYCGVKPDRLDPDHVVPLSRGGANLLSNLLPTCPACNSDKCAHTLDEWAISREQRGLPARATHWAPEDRRYHHLSLANVAA